MLITNAPCQVYLPAALVPSLDGGQMPAETRRNQELCSFNSNASMSLKIISSLSIPPYQKALGINTLVTTKKLPEKPFSFVMTHLVTTDPLI